MRFIFAIIFGLILNGNIICQEDKVKELVSQGTELHDQGKYEEAIEKYKSALEIDNNSTLAKYELSFTYMTIKQFDDAIKYSKEVIEQNTDNAYPAFMVLGTSLDMKGNPKDAIKAYEEGLTKFPDNNLLYYNLGLTSYNIGDYDKAEQAAIKAITAKPTHSSSHILLASVMRAKKERVKALLPNYYFLLLEPNSKRSLTNLNILKAMLYEGVEQKSDDSIMVNIPSSTLKDSIWGAVELFISLSSASRYTDTNKNKSDIELFVETNSSLFSILGELKKNNTNLWWDLYVNKFYDLVQTKNYEAFTYYISQSSNSVEVRNWIVNHSIEMQLLKNWINK